jgi:hypothetical protein
VPAKIVRSAFDLQIHLLDSNEMRNRRLSLNYWPCYDVRVDLRRHCLRLY